MIKRYAFTAIAVLLTAFTLGAQPKDTVYVSDLYTTHIIFQTDITYGDVSNTEVLMSKIVETAHNLCALRAKAPFETTCNVSLMESNGRFHTFIVKYCKEPAQLYYSIGGTAQQASMGTGSGASFSSNIRKSDAPELKAVLYYPRELYHLSTTKQKVQFNCENIFAYSDITYITLSLTNKSGVSYEVKDASFAIEDNSKARHKIEAEPVTLLPKNKYGSLIAAPGETGKIAYTLDKITLAPDKVLRIYLYEQNGQRNLVLTLTPKDINLAAQPDRD